MSRRIVISLNITLLRVENYTPDSLFKRVSFSINSTLVSYSSSIGPWLTSYCEVHPSHHSSSPPYLQRHRSYVTRSGPSRTLFLTHGPRSTWGPSSVSPKPPGKLFFWVFQSSSPYRSRLKIKFYWEDELHLFPPWFFTGVVRSILCHRVRRPRLWDHGPW